MAADHSASIVSKVWNYAHIRKNAGVGYGDYAMRINRLPQSVLSVEFTGTLSPRYSPLLEYCPFEQIYLCSRQNLLLNLHQAAGGRLPTTDLQKLLFLCARK